MVKKPLQRPLFSVLVVQPFLFYFQTNCILTYASFKQNIVIFIQSDNLYMLIGVFDLFTLNLIL